MIYIYDHKFMIYYYVSSTEISFLITLETIDVQNKENLCKLKYN